MGWVTYVFSNWLTEITDTCNSKTLTENVGAQWQRE